MGITLQGKTAIVTGAASGMGKAIAQQFVKFGANVTFTDINEAGLKEAIKQCPAEQAQYLVADVSNKEDVKSTVEHTINQFGSIDILVNCAGIPQSFIDIEKLDEEQWNKTLDVNLKSIYLFSKYVTPQMKTKKNGAIVNIVSIAGVRARPGLNAYSASKGGAIMLTKALAIELAPYNIRVNAINPGPTDSPMINQFIGEDSTNVEEDKKRIFIDSIPLGSLIETEDIAKATLFLASDWAKNITGTVLDVDGGRGI